MSRRKLKSHFHHGTEETNPTGEPWGCGFYPWPRSVGQGSGIAVSCGVGPRDGSDPTLLWLWCGPEATALIGPLAWELPYAAGVTLKRQNICIYIVINHNAKEYEKEMYMCVYMYIYN